MNRSPMISEETLRFQMLRWFSQTCRVKAMEPPHNKSDAQLHGNRFRNMSVSYLPYGEVFSEEMFISSVGVFEVKLRLFRQVFEMKKFLLGGFLIFLFLFWLNNLEREEKKASGEWFCGSRDVSENLLGGYYTTLNVAING